MLAIDSKKPIKWHVTVNFPALIPSKHILATSLVFIEPDDAAMIEVSSGLFFSSKIPNNKNQLISHHESETYIYIWTKELRAAINCVILQSQFFHVIYDYQDKRQHK